MGIDLVYFVASNDQEAVAIEDAGWPVDLPDRSFSARGYDPMVTLGTLEKAITGRDYDLITEDPRSGEAPVGSTSESDTDFVLTITDSLRDALAEATDDQLQDAAEQWSQTEELGKGYWHDSTVADHLKFIEQLQALARLGVSDNSQLYCFVSM